MAQADPSLSEIRSRITQGAVVLALYQARGIVKDQLKRELRRLADVEAREISERARQYLEAHPDLVADCRPIIQGWFLRGQFGKRAQRACAALLSAAQTQNPQSSMASAVQISGAK
jgi:hypothetical protein